MNRHEEEGINLGGWRDTGLFPPLAADENASSTDVVDVKKHRNVFRMIQNESLDRNLKRHHITGQADPWKHSLAPTDIVGRYRALGDHWDWPFYQFGRVPGAIGLRGYHIIILICRLDCHGCHDVPLGNGLGQARARCNIRISQALR